MLLRDKLENHDSDRESFDVAQQEGWERPWIEAHLAAEKEEWLECQEAYQELIELNLYSLALLHVSGGRDARKAQTFASLALERGGENPDGLAILGMAQYAGEQRMAAVRSLEKAIGLPHARKPHEELLERYRRELLPNLASYASIDWALERRPPNPVEDAALLNDFRAVIDEDGKDRLAYMSGRILQRAGQARAAAERFAKLAAVKNPQVEHFTLLRCIFRPPGSDPSTS